MDKYVFDTTKINWETNTTSLVKVIRYKCLICQYEHEYDATWTDEKKAEVQAEMDAHHAEHLNFDGTLESA
jgi:hypothetical protein